MARSRFMDGHSSSRARRRVGVPIPTFATGTLAATEGPQWNVESLVEAECAISTYFATRKRAALDLQEFTHLTEALTLPVETTIEDLSRGEALLLDLLVCASPTLYEFVQISFQKQNGGKTWCLRVVEFDGNRLQKLRSLASVSQIAVDKRDSILAQIRLCKQQQTTQHEHAVAPKKNSFSIDTLFPTEQKQELATLHERVAARAQAKLELQKEVSDQAALGDPDVRLRLADALWSHSRHIYLRQSRLQSLSPKRTNQKTIPRPCVMTMKDVMQLLQGSNTTSRKQVIESMLELQRIAPQWIVFDGVAVTKKTTVWIHPVDYSQLREIIGGVETRTSNTSTTASRKRKTASTGISLSDNAKTMDRRNIDASPTPPSTPSRVLNFDGASVVAGTEGTASSQMHVAIKKAKTLDSPSEVGDRKRRLRTPSPSDDQKCEIPARKKVKGDNSLRINHNLILTDADYDGGEVITPSYTSPRGLKGLFTQLNAGHRI